jgi:hypothetical protein
MNLANQSYNGSHDRRNYHRPKIKQAMLFSVSFPFDDRSPFVHSKSIHYIHITLLPSSNNKTLNARLLASVITGCHYT